MEKLYIIKIGGNVIDSEKDLHSFLKEVAALPERKILVHGGGKIATSIGKKMGIESKYLNGRRITDKETLDLVTMVYGGLVNKRITALLQSFGVNATGVTGVDANLIPAVRRPVKSIDFGWAGDVEAGSIPAGQWGLFLENGLMPVVAPLTHDGAGNMLNTNADTIASVLAVALACHYEVSLLYCFEKEGVLRDVQDDTSVIRYLSAGLYRELKEAKRLFEGILPKIDNAFEALAKGVACVMIGHSADLPLLIRGEKGTQVKG